MSRRDFVGATLAALGFLALVMVAAAAGVADSMTGAIVFAVIATIAAIGGLLAVAKWGGRK